MPLIFPYPAVAGDTYTDNNSVVWQYDGVKWNVITGTTKKVYNGVNLGFSVPWSLTAIPTLVTWDVENFDTGQYWNPTTPTRIVIPQTGFYQINAVFFADAIGEAYTITVKKNGTTVLSSTNMNANQSASYVQILEFNVNDYIEVYAHDDHATGAFTTGTFFEMTQMGLSLGTGVSSNNAFSGVRTILSSAFNTNVTPTPIAWSTTDFNTNANSLGVNYWNALNPGKITVAVNGYYQINAFIKTGGLGSYTITLRKNGSVVISTTTLGANDSAQFDEINNLNANDYLEILVSDTAALGSITTASFFELVRMGVN